MLLLLQATCRTDSTNTLAVAQLGLSVCVEASMTTSNAQMNVAASRRSKSVQLSAGQWLRLSDFLVSSIKAGIMVRFVCQRWLRVVIPLCALHFTSSWCEVCKFTPAMSASARSILHPACFCERCKRPLLPVKDCLEAKLLKQNTLHMSACS